MNEEKKSNGAWAAFTQRFAIPLLTASIGFGSSQMLAVQTLRDRVNYNTQHLEHLDQAVINERDARIAQDTENRREVENARLALQKQTDDARSLTEKRMEYVVGLMEALIKQDTEVIALIKVQQQFSKP